MVSSGADDDDDLPSLDHIFSKATSYKAQSEQAQKENISIKGSKNIQATFLAKNTSVKTLDKVQVPDQTIKSKIIQKGRLGVNTAVFAKNFYKQQFVPAVILENKNDGAFYKTRYFDGYIEENLGREYIFSPDDSEFFKIQVMSLKQVQHEMGGCLRVKVKEDLIREVDCFKDLLLQIMTGSIESERDETFRKSIQTRHKLNSEMRPGPFSYAERDFLMDHLQNVFVPSLLKSEVGLVDFDLLEGRFDCKGKTDTLRYLLRQYSHLVLLPEFTLRIMMKRDEELKTVEEANRKLLFSDEFDLLNGNYIHYLYSKQEMYSYARRERLPTESNNVPTAASHSDDLNDDDDVEIKSYLTKRRKLE